MKNYFQKIITLFTGNDYPESTQQDFYKWLVDEEHTSEKDEALQKLWDEAHKRGTATDMQESYELLEGRRIPLRHNLFDEDAIVLEKTSGEVLLHSTKGKKAVKVSYADMPYVGFWHMPCMDAPYVCIEPWCSLPSRQGITENLEEQKNLISLEAGRECQISWTMEIL